MKTNLTKENFFDALASKYPKAFKMFLNWIDAYKTTNEWHELFVDKTPILSSYEGVLIKFHHLPLAMQKGIILEFYDDTFESKPILKSNIYAHVQNSFKASFDLALSYIEKNRHISIL